MKRIEVYLAEGFEEMEAVIPIDLWRRVGLDVNMIGVTGGSVTGAHGITINCDTTLDMLDTSILADALFLPGGLPGSHNLAASATLVNRLSQHDRHNALMVAICAAPAVVFGAHGLLRGRQYTCYPGQEQKITDGVYLNQPVVRDGRLITGAAAGAAARLATEVIKELADEKRAADVITATQFDLN